MATARKTGASSTSIVTIDEVNLDKGVIQTRDKYGGKYSVLFRHTSGVTRVPSVGETWTIKRENNYYVFDTFLDLDSTDNLDFSTLDPGDVKINSKATVRISGTGVVINNHPIGVRKWEYFEVEPRQVPQFILEDAPIAGSVQVFGNGLLINPNLLVISDVTVKIEAILSGWFTIYYDFIPEVS